MNLTLKLHPIGQQILMAVPSNYIQSDHLSSPPPHHASRPSSSLQQMPAMQWLPTWTHFFLSLPLFSQFSIGTQITGHSEPLVCCKPPRGPISLTVEAKVTEQPAGLLRSVPVGCPASSPDTLFSGSHPSHTQGQHIAIPLSGTFYPVHSTFPYHDAFVLRVCAGGGGSLCP